MQDSTAERGWHAQLNFVGGSVAASQLTRPQDHQEGSTPRQEELKSVKP
jgi:hypothetical protein